MPKLQEHKSLVLRFYTDLDNAKGDEIAAVLRRYVTDGYHWRGVHPFYEQHGANSVAEVFWQPLRRSLTSMQRRQDIFMAGVNDVDGSEWVCSMGYLLGLFDHDWIGIPSNRKMIFLRYADFNRISNGRICETALFCDILNVMQQLGLPGLPPQTGADMLIPGPRTHDGLLFEPQDAGESRKTIDLINRMIDDLVSSDIESPADELAETWHNDMIWFGPAGIGSTYTLDRYQEQHQGPFSEGLEKFEFGGHVCRFSEGKYGGFFGWPNLRMNARGGFMGLPASDQRLEMRIVDIYRRDGDKLSENWNLIDMLYFLAQQGVDLLAQVRRSS